MKRFSHLFPFTFALLLAAACGGKTASDGSAADTTETPLAVEQGPGHDEPRHVAIDTTWNRHRYRIAIACQSSDSLPQVKDRFGDPYLDNIVRLTVTRDDSVQSSHAFTKADFVPMLGSIDGKNLILGGMAFSSIGESGIVFGAQLNSPDDEEGGVAFKVRLPLNGQATPSITRDSNQFAAPSSQPAD